MSISSFLLVLLLCLSLHACDARRPAAADKKFHISFQNDEKKMSVAPKVEPSSSSNKAEESITKTHQLDDNSEHHKLKKESNKKAEEKLIKAEESNIARKSGAIGNKESFVSVPWRVPHNKRGEKHPGFNLDYSPPKTHPPSHN